MVMRGKGFPLKGLRADRISHVASSTQPTPLPKLSIGFKYISSIISWKKMKKIPIEIQKLAMDKQRDTANISLDSNFFPNNLSNVPKERDLTLERKAAVCCFLFSVRSCTPERRDKLAWRNSLCNRQPFSCPEMLL